MKQRTGIVITVFTVLSTISLAQNNPYEALGCMELSHDEVKAPDNFRLTNPDTSAEVSAMVFAWQDKEVQLMDEKDSVVQRKDIAENRMYRWLSRDPLAYKYPSLSPYNAMANNPVTYIDPDGKAPKSMPDQIARVKIMTLNNKLDKGIDDIFSKSKEADKEMGAFVVERVVEGGEKNTSFVNITTGNQHDITVSWPEDVENAIAFFHTHQTKLETFNEGWPFSSVDVNALRDFKHKVGFMAIVESNTQRFFLIIQDVEKAEAFFAENSKETIDERMGAILKKCKNEKLSGEVAAMALGDVLQDSGIGFYTVEKGVENGNVYSVYTLPVCNQAQETSETTPEDSKSENDEKAEK